MLVSTIGIFKDHRRKNMSLEAQDTRPSWKRHLPKVCSQVWYVSFSPCLCLPCSRAGYTTLKEELAMAIQGPGRLHTRRMQMHMVSSVSTWRTSTSWEPGWRRLPMGERGEAMGCLWQLMDDVILVCGFCFGRLRDLVSCLKIPFCPLFKPS